MSEENIRGMSTTELVRRLVNNMSSLVDRNVDLAKEEARSDASRVGIGAGLLVFGGLLLYTFLVALVSAAVLAVYGAMGAIQPVSAALIVAAVFFVLGLIITGIGYATVRVKPMERTLKSVKEDIEWAKNRMS